MAFGENSQDSRFNTYKQMGWGEAEIGPEMAAYKQWLTGQSDKDALAKQRLAEAETNRLNAEAAHAAQMKSQGLNPDGSPLRQEWDSLIDAATGKLKSGYTMDIKALDPSQWEGYSKYKTEALRDGPSTWANLQRQQNDAATLNNKEAAARQAMSAMNQGNSALAMKGGLSAGARGLAARASGRDMLMARQSASRAGDTANLQTMTTDEANRINQLAALSTSEQNIGQYNKNLEAKQSEYNINNLLNENQGKRAYNDMTYQEQMKKWAADKQAQATANSGGGGGKK